ncbi:MAG: tetratricopeptide repeat protein [Acidimicrobiia bacterium]|nr:tetratricopeptide repeat protein [Acidimicrobiia bacterium]
MATRPGFAFVAWELDPKRKQLFRDGEPVAIGSRHFDLLNALVSQAGRILTKDQLIAAAWDDVAVTNNSVEQVISALRRLIGSSCIETLPRRGYRFIAEVTRTERRETDEALDALLAPHRAWIEGRAALETPQGTQIQHAHEVFERVLAVAPDQAAAHVGLANACLFRFEMTRADITPDRDALVRAAEHAREACRLDPEYGEAWATLGFVLARTGHDAEGRAALRRAVVLEPDNWRHRLRLSYGSWGKERLRASSRTLALLPDFPMAHWLAATVHVARHALGEAERELRTGLAAQARQSETPGRFGAVALHWLSGLLALARDDDETAMREFERELAAEGLGLLYERECCANVEYAIGALHLRRRRPSDAGAAFERALARTPGHVFAQVGLARARAAPTGLSSAPAEALPGLAEHARTGSPVDVALVLMDSGAVGQAAAIIEQALDASPPGQAGWLLPVEPLLHVHAQPDAWAAALTRLATRAA